MKTNNNYDLLKEDELYLYIENLLETGTLESLIDLVKLIISMVEHKKDYTDMLDNICSDFIFDFNMDYGEFDIAPFTQIESPNTLSFFVAKYILLTLEYFKISMIDNLNQTKILDYKFLLKYLEGYEKISDKPLDQKVIQQLIEIYLDYDKDKKIAYNQFGKPLIILTIDFSNKNSHSMYHPTSNIILFNTIEKQKNFSPEYVLLHELGHALQLKATNNPSVVPYFFENKIIPYMFPTAEFADFPEIFADCLSAILMKDTKFENKNKDCEIINNEDLKILDNYFKKLVSEI
ncbi:MAG: hypothetical protein ACOCUI_03650 [bacterium]